MRSLLPLLLLSTACRSDKPDATEPTDGPAETTETADPAPDLWQERHAPILEAIERTLQQLDAPGLSVAILEGGELTFAAGFGSARPDEDVTVTRHTLFQLGSTTKMHTALAVLQEVDAGRATLETPLSAVLPGWDMASHPGSFDQITLADLLAHRGAFYDAIESGSAPEDDALAGWLTGYAEDYWLMAEPGQFWNYNNPGFSFAGLALEALDPAGRSYAARVVDDVFRPLGMTRTVFHKADALADGDFALGVGLNVGREVTYGPLTMRQIDDHAAGRPAGQCTWSTPEEQLAMARFLLRGDPAILSDALRAALTTPQAAMPTGGHYGLGLMLDEGLWLGDEYHATPVWTHGGNTYGYTSAFYVLPEHGFAISVMSSGYGDDLDGIVAAAIEALVDLGAPEPPPTHAFDPSRLDDHVGTYVDRVNGAFTFTRQGDALRIDWPLLAQYNFEVDPEVVWVTRDSFAVFIDGDPVVLSFIGEPGTPSGFAAHRSIVGTRSEAQVVRQPVGAPRPTWRHQPARYDAITRRWR